MELRMEAMYRTLASLVDHERGKDLLNFLADEERQHAVEVQSLVEGNIGKACLNRTMDHAGEVFSILRMDLDDLASQAAKLEWNLDAMLAFAIDMEKDSVVFYVTLKKMVVADEGKARIDAIIEQEVAHVVALSKKLAELN